MPQRITPTQIVTVTKDGECQLTITLELNINLNANGIAQLAVQAQQVPKTDVVDKKEDNFEWSVPDFTPGNFNSSMINFGKDVENGNG
jgi:hypothetical protein